MHQAFQTAAIIGTLSTLISVIGRSVHCRR